MIEITKAKARLWSRLGARAVLGQALLEAAKERDDFYVLSADLAQSSGLGRFRSEFPDRLINTGIAEQNMIGIAAGLAKDGTNVFATSFSPFVTMRACEQVRMNMGYMQLNIKTVGLGSGLVMAQLGNSRKISARLVPDWIIAVRKMITKMTRPVTINQTSETISFDQTSPWTLTGRVCIR